MRAAILCLVLAVGTAGCGPEVDVAKALELNVVNSGWFDAGIINGQNKLVPAVTITIKNHSDQTLGLLQLNSLFRQANATEEWGSAFLTADAAHTGSDILVTLLALVSLVLARRGYAHLDAVLAIAVALIIAWSGYRILRESIPILVDERAIAAQDLRSVVLAVPDIRDVRKVRSRSTASGQLFAEVTIAVSGSTPVDEAHRLADAVEEAIAREFGTSEVTVHVEPA